MIRRTLGRRNTARDAEHLARPGFPDRHTLHAARGEGSGTGVGNALSSRIHPSAGQQVDHALQTVDPDSIYQSLHRSHILEADGGTDGRTTSRLRRRSGSGRLRLLLFALALLAADLSLVGRDQVRTQIHVKALLDV